MSRATLLACPGMSIPTISAHTSPSAADVLVLPSHQENFGISVAEALACGTPALISNKVNIWREVEKSGAGIVGEDDLAGTCGLLRCWLETTDAEKAEFRRRARACFLREFEIKQASETLVRTLTNIIEGRSPHAGRNSNVAA